MQSPKLKLAHLAFLMRATFKTHFSIAHRLPCAGVFDHYKKLEALQCTHPLSNALQLVAGALHYLICGLGNQVGWVTVQLLVDLNMDLEFGRI